MDELTKIERLRIWADNALDDWMSMIIIFIIALALAMLVVVFVASSIQLMRWALG